VAPLLASHCRTLPPGRRAFYETLLTHGDVLAVRVKYLPGSLEPPGSPGLADHCGWRGASHRLWGGRPHAFWLRRQWSPRAPTTKGVGHDRWLARRWLSLFPPCWPVITWPCTDTCDAWSRRATQRAELGRAIPGGGTS